MKLSTKGRYGLRALIDLTVNSEDGHVSLVSIANRSRISVHYLEHVFSSLKRDGIVRSVKGAQGGYTLGDAPERITAARILRALEGNYGIEPEPKSEDAVCGAVSAALDALLWSPVNEATQQILEQVTLADLVNYFHALCENGTQMYYI